MKIICIRKNICSPGKNDLLFLLSKMAAVQSLYKGLSNSQMTYNNNNNYCMGQKRDSKMVIYRIPLESNFYPKKQFS